MKPILKFLDTRLLLANEIITTYRKANEFLVHWKSQIPKKYKGNPIKAELLGSWRISSSLYYE